MMMEYYCTTDIGLVREKNQDSYMALSNGYGDLLILVADGIGGMKAGEVASGEAIKYFEESFRSSGPFAGIEDAISFLHYHISGANRQVFDLSNTYVEYSGMGTTLTGVMITGFGNVVLNIGDSRVYGFIDGKIIHLTRDDTLVNQMLDEGKISYEEALNHPKKHYLVKALGIYEDVEADVHRVKDMEYYLVCSDGLHAYVPEEEISKIVYDPEMSVQEKVISLKDLALLKGGYDNTTIVLLKV